MRLLQLVQQAQLRGAEIDALQLGDEFERRGVEVRTAYLYAGSGEGVSSLKRDRDIHLMGSYGSFLERLPGWNPSLLGRLRRVVAEFAPDVIQAGGGRTVKYGALARPRRGGGCLIWRNIGEIDRWMRGRVRRGFYQALVLPRVDLVISMTSSGAASFRAVFGTRVPLTDIPPGIDPGTLQAGASRGSSRDRVALTANGPVALLVGALSAEKRIDVALRAFARARHRVPDLQLWLAGSGPLQEELGDLAERLGIAGEVVFLGARDDIGDLLRAADLLLISSDTEGLPRVLLEGALMGTPVVSTAVGGIPDVLHHGRTGMLSIPGDADELASNMVRVLEEADLANRLALGARSWAEANATISAVADRYQEIYRRLSA